MKLSFGLERGGGKKKIRRFWGPRRHTLLSGGLDEDKNKFVLK